MSTSVVLLFHVFGLLCIVCVCENVSIVTAVCLIFGVGSLHRHGCSSMDVHAVRPAEKFPLASDCAAGALCVQGIFNGVSISHFS